MVADGRYLAVVDRFEGDHAVVLLEEDDEVVGDVAVARDRLPEAARHSDAVLAVVVRDGGLAEAEYRPEETERRRASARERFDRLARRPPDEQGDENAE